MAKKVTTTPHRGRFQAQGGGLEESERWAQNEEYLYDKAKEDIEKLRTKISATAFKDRKPYFKQCEAHVETLHQNGGIDVTNLPFYSASFQHKNTGNKRVDLEVFAGKAFI